MKRLAGLVIAAAFGAFSAPDAHAQSAFGCSQLSSRAHLPVVEGTGGVFFRVQPDLQMFHGLSDQSVAQVSALSAALKELGTTLIYLPVPTKSLAMPDNLTAETEDFGFDPHIATTVYLDTLRRLQEQGVVAVDARQALLNATPDQPAFHRADHRITATGAQRTAQAVADRLRSDPGYDLLTKAQFSTVPAGVEVLESAMRNQLQQNCLMALPDVETALYKTTKVQSAAVVATSSLFAETQRSSSIAVVGTEYTGEPSANFAGFLSDYTGLDVMQYSVEGGGAFAAISSYMTSENFQTSRPSYLIWEVPVYSNLGQFADQPMRELIAAAGNNCRVPLRVMVSEGPHAVRVDLTALDPGLDYTLLLDTDGAASDEATFAFTNRAGLIRTKSIMRHADQVKTGRFYMPMSGLWADGAAYVDIDLSVPFGGNPRIAACFY
ncbi:hypothetical protein [Thalassococcus sp. S3]|uniref:alginate O-acetyltransferase AlgX-related protein n=1 Tax=Thalassococcus sp. S3 TaxID=2017482 RepID=UPI001024464C|nr:hypothetical protein [Thalassococcus sp. S3]QBF30869.1 hypothetical protein CFI11_06520 [Thalassococcus sp. S3]